MKNQLFILLLVAVSLAQLSCTVPGGSAASGRDAGGEAYFALEAHSGKIVSSRNGQATRPIGSLVQVATAVVVFDWATATGSSLAAQVVVTPDLTAIGGSNPMGLQAGDQIALRDALYSVLLGSDTVSAQILANHVGREVLQRRGGFGSDPVTTFVGEMNQLAGALEMRRTTFSSPHGLENRGRPSLSTAEDLARLSVYAMRHPGLAFYTKQKSRQIGYLRGGQRLAFNVANTNTLVGRDNIDGLRAGNSLQSGPNLIISADRKPIVEKLAGNQTRVTPRRMVVVVLASPSREGRALALLNAGWSIYDQWSALGGAAVAANPNGPPQILNVPKLQL